MERLVHSKMDQLSCSLTLLVGYWIHAHFDIVWIFTTTTSICAYHQEFLTIKCPHLPTTIHRRESHNHSRYTPLLTTTCDLIFTTISTFSIHFPLSWPFHGIFEKLAAEHASKDYNLITPRKSLWLCITDRNWNEICGHRKFSLNCVLKNYVWLPIFMY